MIREHKPLIAIPCRTVVDVNNGFEYSGIPLTYTRMVEQAGGAPILIPLELSEDSLRAIFERTDGLLLAGGVDVHPKEYGEEVEPFCGDIDLRRDELELRVTQWALDDVKPVFGVCRGVQMLNVAAGGSLYQDIPAQLGRMGHDYRKGDPYDLRAHPLEIDSDSRLARALGATAIEVNSLHHQALKQVAPGLKVVARAPDGVVEAVEADDGQRFILGVQFHPELLRDDRRMLHLFEDFVASARLFHERNEFVQAGA